MDRFPRDVPSRRGYRDAPVRLQIVPPSEGGPAARIVSTNHVSSAENNGNATPLKSPSPDFTTDPRAVPSYLKQRGLAERSNQTGLSNFTPWMSYITPSVIANEAMDSGLPNENAQEQSHDEDDETHEQFKARFTNIISKMMFVSGETAEPSQETTTLIEEIVRQQVVEMLTRSTALAARRGVRSISTDDLIFLIRHDKAKVSRLKTFLSWKDVRKNVKDSDDKGGGDAADFGGADDPLAGAGVAGPTDVAAKPKNKRAKVGLPWDVNSFYSIQVPEREDEEDEDEEEQNYATLQRLANADERTKHMTKEEYVFWSDCRQASFTFRKGKRFREWAGFGVVTDSRPNDDIVDILGFLTFEIVQTLTEGALKVKEQADRGKKGAEITSGENGKKRKREPGLFDPPAEGRTPIEPRHIHEAYRKLQATPNRAVAMLLHGGRAPVRTPLRLI